MNQVVYEQRTYHQTSPITPFKANFLAIFIVHNLWVNFFSAIKISQFIH